MAEAGMKTKMALGWSQTFMKQGMSLMLLLLFEGDSLQEGLRAMQNRAISACGFTSGDYFKGTNRADCRSDSEEFSAIFDEWKESVEFSKADRDVWMNKMESWIAQRTKAIMENNRRNYYGECASYIAALGEVQQSFGDAGAKVRLMEKYRQEYSRRRAFHEELRRYGMKK
jgi:hypothetical protein